MANLIQNIQLWDERMIVNIIARRKDDLTLSLKFVSRMGDGYLWCALTVIFYMLTDVTPEWLVMGISAYAVEIFFYKIIKQSTSRKRPCHEYENIKNLIVPQDQYSFPSGHTAAATVAALLFSTALPVVAPLFFLLTILIAFSRIYLGVHYPSDVLMGFVLGVFSFSVSFIFF